MLDPRKVEEYKRYFAEFNVVLKGELDAEYKRLKTLCDEWDKRNNLVQEMGKVETAKNELAAAQDVFLKDKAASQGKLLVWEEGLKKKEASLAASMRAHDEARSVLAAAQGAHATISTAAKVAMDKRSAELDQKARDLENLQAALHARDVKLAEREAKVHSVLSTLNTVSTR